jgi:hypothetical protein
LSTAFTASPASASATGCSWCGAVGPVKGIPVYNGNMCFTVNGSGNRVDSVVSRTPLPYRLHAHSNKHDGVGNRSHAIVGMAYLDTGKR